MDRLVAASPRRADLEATLGTGGYVVLVDGPDQAMAVANVVAPEHLELLVEDAEALLPLVRRAGAVFLGPYAPASVGDYLAGPNHVLPTARTARFASALRVDDFRTHIHVVSMDARRPGPPRTARGRHRRRPRGCRRTPSRCVVRGERRDGRARPAAPRPGAAVGVPLPPGRRRGAAQHQRVAAAAARRSGSTSCATSSGRIDFNRYPDRDATELRAALGEFHGVDPARVFCANGSNEVLQCLLLAYGGAGRTVALFEPTYALHRHIASLTATEVVRGWRGPDHRVDLDVVDRRPRRGPSR